MEFFQRIRQVIRANFNAMIPQEKKSATVGFTFDSRECLKDYPTIAEIAINQRDGQEEMVEMSNHSLVTLEKKQVAVNNLNPRFYDSTQFSQILFSEYHETITIPDHCPQFQKYTWKDIEEFFISLTSSSEIEKEWTTLEEFASKISV